MFTFAGRGNLSRPVDSGPCRSLAVVSCLYESGLFLRRGRFVKNRLMKSDVSGEAGGSELKPDGKHLIQDDGICS
ncbi:hypothetical protein F2P81_016469 [Scophthalmus maximus]|uniref:Uncharacterized protein n=1 Tax=Scophthalmus maximus TaxID=52904 RepID=A0A6A4SLK5_SCOMX|nr:hypothetical protein F2P81_016469 [Scophthalmus maximus]